MGRGGDGGGGERGNAHIRGWSGQVGWQLTLPRRGASANPSLLTFSPTPPPISHMPTAHLLHRGIVCMLLGSLAKVCHGSLCATGYLQAPSLPTVGVVCRRSRAEAGGGGAHNAPPPNEDSTKQTSGVAVDRQRCGQRAPQKDNSSAHRTWQLDVHPDRAPRGLICQQCVQVVAKSGVAGLPAHLAATLPDTERVTPEAAGRRGHTRKASGG